MSYQSPIELIMKEMNMSLEGEICKAVQKAGVNVDREELVRALQYDRGQYQKGYNDGFEYGYQTAVKDVIKRLKEMKTYGGDNKKKCAAEVPEGTGRAAEPVQREV